MFDKSIDELSKLYNVEESIVIDSLKSSIEEILTQDLGYRVNAVVKDNNIRLIAEVNQHGILTYQELTLNRIKNHHISEITRLLNFKLHHNEADELYSRYAYLSGKLVSGRILKQVADDYLIKLDICNDNNDELIAVCNRDFIFKQDLESDNSKYFQVVHARVIQEENIFRLALFLTRLSKKLPVLILEMFEPENKLKHIQCVLRQSGRFSILTTDSKISKDNLSRLQSEFYGEYFKVNVRRKEVVVNE